MISNGNTDLTWIEIRRNSNCNILIFDLESYYDCFAPSFTRREAKALFRLPSNALPIYTRGGLWRKAYPSYATLRHSFAYSKSLKHYPASRKLELYLK